MKQYFLTLMFILLLSVSFGQYTNAAFEATKGKWTFPISHIASVDTIQRDCSGMPARSFSMILWTQTPEEVTAIQSGLVQSIHKIDSLNVIAVKAASYFLFYFGLATLNVKKGDTINEGDILGRLGKENNENNYQILLTLMNKTGHEIDLIPWFDWTTAHNNCLPQQQLTSNIQQ